MKKLSFLKKKWVRYMLIALGVFLVIWFIFFRGNKVVKEPFSVKVGDFLQQVSVSGKVVPKEDVSLSFGQSGQVRRVYVKVGDQVNAGKLLAIQDVSELQAQYAEMQAGIDLQNAKLTQLLAGASAQNIKVSQDAVVSAQQDLDNAYQNAVVSMNGMYSTMSSAYVTALYTQNTYFSAYDQQGLKVQDARLVILHAKDDTKSALDTIKNTTDGAVINAAVRRTTLNISTINDSLRVMREQEDQSIYYSQVTSADKASLDTQKTNMNAALVEITGSAHAISSATLALQQAQNQLELTKAAPRDTDINVFKAQIDQAKASAQNVSAQIRKREVFAPISGTITAVDAKVGSIMNSGEVAVSLISNGNFEIESYVPEIYVGLVKVGNEAEVLLDAYADKKFAATVVSIDPSETIKDGVSTYKTKLELTDSDNQIKTGMTANIVITTEKKSNVISIPQGLVIVKDGQRIVKVQKDNHVVEQKVDTGDISSSGYIEIISGLKEGDALPQ